jgi:hypothetical protein
MIAGLGERERESGSGRQAYVDSTTGDDCRLRAYRDLVVVETAAPRTGAGCLRRRQPSTRDEKSKN